MTTQPEPMNFEEEATKILIKYRDAPTEPSGTIHIGDGLGPRTADITWPIDEALKKLQTLAYETALKVVGTDITTHLDPHFFDESIPEKLTTDKEQRAFGHGWNIHGAAIRTNLKKAFGGQDNG